MKDMDEKKYLDMQNSFSVPENYFDTLTERVMMAVEAESGEESAEVKQPIRHSPLRRWLTVASAAAVLAGLLIGGYAVVDMQRNLDAHVQELVASQDNYSELLMEELESYQMEEFLADMNGY